MAGLERKPPYGGDIAQWEAYFAPLAEAGARQREIEERDRNRVLEKAEIDARWTACSACEHNKGHDALRVFCAAPCKTCRKRKEDGFVHRAVTLAREKCPLYQWEIRQSTI